jgi:hypothetical protein
MKANVPVPVPDQQPMPVVIRRVVGWIMLGGALSVSSCVALFT